ncbi:DUF4349 domain-containing protein [Vallitalea okinawensis]|uniref:DUF4349 domain-containing protein n=1 Tax=Vallitalea okinawensis TaxID=2078660 RepID=UPI000CFD61C0|nr:DUF4349 domain-containing protein [Vallitalea okinawensis]
MKKIISLFVLVVMLLMVVSGCSSKESQDSVANEAAYDRGATTAQKSDEVKLTFGEATGYTSQEEAKEEPKEESATSDNSDGQEENTEKSLGDEPKLIITRYYDIETLDYERSTQFIEEQVKHLDGYIEHSEIEGGSINNQYGYRSAYYKVRIPKGKEDVFVERLGDIGVITNKREEAEDVTLEYYDMESRLHTKEVQQERLLAILDEADDLEAIIKLEKELAEVTYEIDSMTSQLKRWDNLIDYTTLYISLHEVQEVTEVVFNPSLGDKISKTFQGSIEALKSLAEGLLLLTVGAIPFIIILGILAAFIIPIWKKNRKKIHLNKKKDDEE